MSENEREAEPPQPVDQEAQINDQSNQIIEESKE